MQMDVAYTTWFLQRAASAVCAAANPSVCHSVCPSVCPSHSGIVEKRGNAFCV